MLQRLVRKVRQLAGKREQKALVLMYHRIAEPGIDPWDLAVSPSHFEQQLNFLKEKYRVVSIPELDVFIKNGEIPHNCVCLSFDDGYRDNFEVARLLLEACDVPATFFISTHYVQQQELFWWDELAEMLLSGPLKQKRITVTIGQETFSFKLDNDVNELESAKAILAWKWPATPPGSRCQAYLTIWEKLRPLPLPEIKAVLNKLAEDLEYSPAIQHPAMAMTTDQLRELSSSRLCTIGLHTHTHPALSAHARQVQEQEIMENAIRLNEITGLNASLLAYPYGDYGIDTPGIVENMDISMAFVSHEATITQRSNPYQLARIQVKDWSPEQLRIRLDKWFRS
jgi:peptidoglycan/xylan/chitin deacetylase (PgdA/CDA1 family)